MMASLDSLGTHIWDGLLEPQEETAQHINCSKEETDEQTAVGTRCGASASNFSRGCNQPASAMQSFGLDDNMEAEMSNEYPYDECYHTPCVPQNPTREESSVLVHGLYTLRTARLPQANVTGAPAQDDRARSTNEHCELPLQATTDSVSEHSIAESMVVPDLLGINDGRENTGLNDATSELLSLLGDETPFGLYDDARLALHMANEDIQTAKWKQTASSPVNPIPSPGPYIPHVYGLRQDSSARVTGQNTPLYNPPLLAGASSVQDNTIHSPPLSQNNPAPQYPVMSDVSTANATGHESVLANVQGVRHSQDGKYIFKSVDNFWELQIVVSCCAQTQNITWDMSKLIKLTDKDRGAFVSRFKQKQKPRILWSSKARLDSEPAIPFTGVPFAMAVCPKKAIPCPNLNCNAQICVRPIWTFPNSACVCARAHVHVSVCIAVCSCIPILFLKATFVVTVEKCHSTQSAFMQTSVLERSSLWRSTTLVCQPDRPTHAYKTGPHIPQRPRVYQLQLIEWQSTRSLADVDTTLNFGHSPIHKQLHTATLHL